MSTQQQIVLTRALVLTSEFVFFCWLLTNISWSMQTPQSDTFTHWILFIHSLLGIGATMVALPAVMEAAMRKRGIPPEQLWPRRMPTTPHVGEIVNVITKTGLIVLGTSLSLAGLGVFFLVPFIDNAATPSEWARWLAILCSLLTFVCYTSADRISMGETNATAQEMRQ